MGYTKNTWQSGDIITKEKLDNMENGIAGAYMPEYIGTYTATNEGSETVNTYGESISLVVSNPPTLNADDTYVACITKFAGTMTAGIYISGINPYIDEDTTTLNVIVYVGNNTGSAYTAQEGDFTVKVALLKVGSADDGDGR